MNKILLVSSEFPPGPGGIGHHAFSLSKQLVKMQFKLEVLSNADYSNYIEVKDFDKKQDFTIRRFKRFVVLTSLLRIFIILYRVYKVKPKNVILTGRFSLLMSFILKIFFRKIELMAIIHGHEPIFGSKIMKELTNFSINWVDQIVAVSDFAMNNLLIKTRENIKCTVIPNGIDLDYLKSWELGKEDSILEGFPILLTVGHISKRKGQHRVIKALPVLLNLYPDIKYHMIGRGIDRIEFELLAKNLGVENSCVFHEPVKNHHDLGKFYNNADVFMLLSENQKNGDVEGFGIVALEANFFGLPVIGAVGSGVKDAVNHLKSGVLVEGDVPSEILHALKYILDNKKSLRESSVEWAYNFNWNNIASRYKEFFV
jgi:phosphatidylinositol alpha-1,6-mannosyltransferase